MIQDQNQEIKIKKKQLKNNYNKRKIMKNIYKLLLLPLFLTSLLFADPSDADERSKSRDLSKEENEQYLNIQKKDFNQLIKSHKKNFNNPNFSEDLPPLIFSHPLHKIYGVKADGSEVIIEDESSWKVKKGYEKEVLNWASNDAVVIVQNDSYISTWFYGYDYKLINKTRNIAVEAKLNLLPKLPQYNPYAIVVTYFDPIRYELYLSDDTIWKIDPYDYPLLSKWLIGDSIIVGSNLYKKWNSNQEFILINACIKKSIKADQVQ
jgi:hypothetical protein